MLCIHCKTPMKRYKVYDIQLNDSYTYTVDNYACPNCRLKIQFSNNPLNYGITKTQVPCHLQPTENQIKAMNTIVYYLPEAKDARKTCCTKKLSSIFISKYWQKSYEARQDLIDKEEIDYGNAFLNGLCDE